METLPQKKTIEEIKKLHEEILDSLNESIRKGIRIGELLIELKGRLKHGEWLPWIKENLSFSDQTARNYMRVYSKREMLNSKGVLNLNQAYRVLAPQRELQAQDVQWEELPEEDEREKIVKVSDLEFNPFFGLWSIDADFVSKLKGSIEHVGFLGGFMARKRNGKYQISHGHHRLVALRLTKIAEVAIYLREMDDDRMVKVMSASNQYRWHVSDPSTINDTIRGTHDYLVSKGRDADAAAIFQFLKPSVSEWQVKEAFEALYGDKL